MSLVAGTNTITSVSVNTWGKKSGALQRAAADVVVQLMLTSRAVADFVSAGRTVEDVVVLLTLASRVVTDVGTVEHFVVRTALPGRNAVDIVVRMALPLRAAVAGSALVQDTSLIFRDPLHDAALLAADAQPRSLLGKPPVSAQGTYDSQEGVGAHTARFTCAFSLSSSYSSRSLSLL